MAKIICVNCNSSFEGDKNFPPAIGAAIAGATLGGTFGASMGIAAGGTAIPATVPLAIIGGVLSGLGVIQFVKCPNCKKIFRK